MTCVRGMLVFAGPSSLPCAAVFSTAGRAGDLPLRPGPLIYAVFKIPQNGCWRHLTEKFTNTQKYRGAGSNKTCRLFATFTKVKGGHNKSATRQPAGIQLAAAMRNTDSCLRWARLN